MQAFPSSSTEPDGHNAEALNSLDIASGSNPTRKSLWHGSSQYRHWRHSKETLRAQRTQINEIAVGAIKNAFDADEPGSSNGIEFLNADDEYALVKLYVGKISQLCSHFRFDEEVEATAMTYLKRFYLKNTVMDWHPKNVMLTALFLAAKTTNHPISLDAYTQHIPKTSPNDVLELEFLLAQSLSFEFAVWHAHRAMWGLWLDLQTLPDSQPESIKDIYNAAIDHVRMSRLTDAEFIYAPAQIALASLHLASSDLAEQWARAKGLNQTELDVIKEAATMIGLESERGGGIDVEVVREVDRRLRLCKNPEKIPGTKAYMKRQAAAEAAAAEKRARKAAAERESQVMEVDVFGENISNEPEAHAPSSPDD
ncbi:cyclin-like protein [Serendipita vermifera]|nr:cyclin-like protein [Serendipita vermifera]